MEINMYEIWKQVFGKEFSDDQLNLNNYCDFYTFCRAYHFDEPLEELNKYVLEREERRKANL